MKAADLERDVELPLEEGWHLPDIDFNEAQIGAGLLIALGSAFLLNRAVLLVLLMVLGLIWTALAVLRSALDGRP